MLKQLRPLHLRPRSIIQLLDLLRPIYEKTTPYGHFDREYPGLTWEHAYRAQELRAIAGFFISLIVQDMVLGCRDN